MADQILSEINGNLGIITLNRIKALNALTTAMCVEITRLMTEWEEDENIGAVLVRGAGVGPFARAVTWLCSMIAAKKMAKTPKSSGAWNMP